MISIVQSPNPILNQVCDPCDLGDKSLKKLAKQMAKAMYKNDGCGLAAPQLGVAKRLVVIDCDQEEGEQNPIVLVNPVLVDTQGDPVVAGEGCLSCPGISVPIARPPFARAPARGRPRSKRGCANHARRVHGHARVRSDHPRRFGGAA